MSSIDIRLREWQSLGPGDPEGAELRGRRLADAGARALASRLSAEHVLGITELHNGISVEAYSHVGRVEVGDVTVTVEPKLAARDLLKLVRYAYGLRDLRLEDTAGFASGLGLFQDLLIAQLHAEVRELVARGLRRRYVARSEELASPQGRIDMQRMASVRAATSATLPCQHHPRSSDFLLNQVLVSGLQLAAILARDPRLRLEVHRLAASLTETIGPLTLSAATLLRARRGLNRMVARYEPALQLVELLYACSSISLDDGSGLRLPGFLFDMNLFFQALLGRFLSDNLPDCNVRAEHSLTDMMRYSRGFNPRGRRPPRPRPDFAVFCTEGAPQLLDAKYRDLWERELPRDMLYQLSVYALSQPAGSTAAILYPTTTSSATEAVIEIADPVHGGVRAYVALRPVVLSRLAAALGSEDGAGARRLAADLVDGSKVRQQRSPDALARQ